jgi:hypothetical protein
MWKATTSIARMQYADQEVNHKCVKSTKGTPTLCAKDTQQKYEND